MVTHFQTFTLEKNVLHLTVSAWQTLATSARSSINCLVLCSTSLRRADSDAVSDRILDSAADWTNSATRCAASTSQSGGSWIWYCSWISLAAFSAKRRRWLADYNSAAVASNSKFLDKSCYSYSQRRALWDNDAYSNAPTRNFIMNFQVIAYTLLITNDSECSTMT